MPAASPVPAFPRASELSDKSYPIDLSAAPGSPTVSSSIANSMCPVLTDEPVDPSILPVEYKGLSIGFCCNKCRKRFQADPEMYVANLPAEAQSVLMGAGVPTQSPDNSGESAAMSASSAGATSATALSQYAAAEGSAHSGEALAELSEHEARERAAKKAAGEAVHGHGHEHEKHGESSVGALEFIGRFHVLVIHFPIALLLAAALAELIGLVSTRSFWRDTGWYCATLGAFGALVAATLGWIAAVYNNDQGMPTVLTLHRWLGTSAAVIALAAVAAHILSTKRDRPGPRGLYLALLFLSALLVGATGHFGGTLIYGLGYFIP